jgi:dsRNA-specific ribonuclease
MQALTRQSARGERVSQNAEYFVNLEFVGDRALNMAVANELYLIRGQ